MDKMNTARGALAGLALAGAALLGLNAQPVMRPVDVHISRSGQFHAPTKRNQKRLHKKHARTLTGQKKSKAERASTARTRRPRGAPGKPYPNWTPRFSPTPNLLTNWQTVKFNAACVAHPRLRDAKARAVASFLLHPKKIARFERMTAGVNIPPSAMLALRAHVDAHHKARAALGIG